MKRGRGRLGLAWGSALVAATGFLSACGINKVEVPLTFSSDRRLHMVSPDDQSVVGLPVTVRWAASGFPLSGGNHFGVFVDQPPVGLKTQVRLVVCSEQGLSPIQIGEQRSPCYDQRNDVFMADQPSYTFSCFSPRYNAAARSRNQHQISVVLLDRNNVRVGQAVADLTIDVDPRAVSRCLGLPGA
ncbi:MAG TPA: hypothetical protein VFW24_18260 [Acidimicrobiales bacterium]|nr:hypothetical protein [Acidimicrobiales bacterium]